MLARFGLVHRCVSACTVYTRDGYGDLVLSCWAGANVPGQFSVGVCANIGKVDLPAISQLYVRFTAELLDVLIRWVNILAPTHQYWYNVSMYGVLQYLLIVLIEKHYIHYSWVTGKLARCYFCICDSGSFLCLSFVLASVNKACCENCVYSQA